ncbi:MAG: MFS transporter [Bdellovibrionales bacterium]|nr:MFS transporter [Bdellovibrionales bacterium]
MAPSLASSSSANRREWAIILALAAIQFTHMVDFVIMMPLGPQFLRAFDITTKQFGWMISAYTYASALVGMLGAPFLDRFDRKKALLFLYSGFIVGTSICAIAPNHNVFILGRIAAGAFAGLMVATVFSIIGDLIPENRRGAATGTVMASFSVASVVGVPSGLWLAQQWGWHAPFFLLAGSAVLVWILVSWVLPPVRGHISASSRPKPSIGKSYQSMSEILFDPRLLSTFVFTVLLMFGSFSVIPYISPYFVTTVGFPESKLPLLYLIGGIFTMFASRGVGILSDRFGKKKVFLIAAFFSLAAVSIITRLPVVPVWVAIASSTFFMITMSGRMVPAMAMLTGQVEPSKRGGFLSLNTALQHLGSGLAATVGGYLIMQAPGQAIQHYDRVGVLAVVSTMLAMALSRGLKGK